MRAIDITPEMAQMAEKIASQWGIPSDLHDQDQLLRQIAKRWGAAAAVERYISGGRTDAAKVRAAIERLKIARKPLRVLDFAAGFGRVARHVKYLMPDNQLHASDIHPEACAFMEMKLGIPSFCSATYPEKLNIGKDYDVIYVMSLFSHLPDTSFGRWLGALYDILAPGGVLIFTANGDATLRLYPAFYGDIFGAGQTFGYKKVSDQLDLDAKDYGTMIVSPRYVLDAVDLYAPGAQFQGFASGTWFQSQDEWILRKPA